MYTINAYAEGEDGEIRKMHEVRRERHPLLAESMCEHLNWKAGVQMNADRSFQRPAPGMPFYMFED